MCLCRCFKDAQTEDLSFQIDPRRRWSPSYTLIHLLRWLNNTQTLVYVSVFSRSKYICNSITVSRGNVWQNKREKKILHFQAELERECMYPQRKAWRLCVWSFLFPSLFPSQFSLWGSLKNSGFLLCNILHMIEGDANSEGLRESLARLLFQIIIYLSLFLTLSQIFFFFKNTSIPSVLSSCKFSPCFSTTHVKTPVFMISS